MRNVSRSVRLVALLLPLAGWIVAREPDSRDSSPGRGAGSIKGLEKADHAAQARVTESYGKLPLSFEANRGQVDLDVKFFSRGRRLRHLHNAGRGCAEPRQRLVFHHFLSI